MKFSGTLGLRTLTSQKLNECDIMENICNVKWICSKWDTGFKITFEPAHGKTNSLQRRRSASQ